MKTNKLRNLLDFIYAGEGLKRTVRHSWLSSGRRESVAEHTWRMAVMAIVLVPELDERVNLEKLLSIILVHDLAEAATGDRPAFKKSLVNKHDLEHEGLKQIIKRLPLKTQKHLLDLWSEFEDGVSIEAKIAHALDKTEVIIQHNQADLKTWTKKERLPAYSTEYGLTYATFNKVFREFRDLVRVDTAKKLGVTL